MPVSNDRGQALTTAIALLVVMFVAGAALLALVDTQSGASGTQRERDASFNAAQGVLQSTTFALAKQWPDKAYGASGARPWVTASCNTQNISSTTASSAAAGPLSGQIDELVKRSVQAHDAKAVPQWSVYVCDAGAETTYSDGAILNRSATKGYDDSSTSGANKVWIRAQATVNGRTTALVSLITRAVANSATLTGSTGPSGSGGTSTTPTPTLVTGISLPTQYSLITGKVEYSGTPSADNLALLANATTHTPYINTLLQLDSNGVLRNNGQSSGSTYGGLGGLRCTSLPSECLGTNPTADLPLLDTSLTDRPRVVPFASETVGGPMAIAALKAYAQSTTSNKTRSTYYAQVNDGASCVPDSPTGDSGRYWVVYIEKIGTNGDGTCNLPSSFNPQIVALVVGSGRIHVTGNSVLPTVIYNQNLQSSVDRKQREVVTIDNGASVQGATWIDGGGLLGTAQPSNVTLNSIIGSPTGGDVFNSLVNQLLASNRLLTQVAASLQATTQINLMLLESATDKVSDLISILGVSNLMTRVQNQIQQSHTSANAWEKDRIDRLNALIGSIAVSQTPASTDPTSGGSGGGTSTGPTGSSGSGTSSVAGTVANTSATFQQIPPR